MKEFSFRTRSESIKRFKEETFDLLIIGGGITGAAVARDATSRGLKVALVERNDFAYGTSSRSSKLIHGGLRYLQNLEFGLVFEALAERAHLLKSAPHVVKPLPFYLPVYKGDSHSKGLLSLGLWLYDLLALFRTPEFHKNLSKAKLLKEIPFLKAEGLVGGFKYFDASMWDDVLAVETLRSASESGAAVANYVEALEPIWNGKWIAGFRVRDREAQASEFVVRAKKTVICTGPWTDEIGVKLSPKWKNWLNPSKGVHLVFDLKRLPVPGAMVMNHPADGRVSFVVPRPDLGPGVVIVGTTDAPSDPTPENAKITSEDVQYLMDLLNKYFPQLNLTKDDILSAYIGVRPLVEPGSKGDLPSGDVSSVGSEPSLEASHFLQKISREHQIEEGPGGTVIVAGGKYTTHRKMAEEIVEFTLNLWKADSKKSKDAPELPKSIGYSKTNLPVNVKVLAPAIAECQIEAKKQGVHLPQSLIDRYGSDALPIVSEGEARLRAGENRDPEGFPFLEEQLKYSIKNEMVVHLEDFYLRRVPLFLARKDHGMPWSEALAKVWAQERGMDPSHARIELEKLNQELLRRSDW